MEVALRLEPICEEDREEDEQGDLESVLIIGTINDKCKIVNVENSHNSQYKNNSLNTNTSGNGKICKDYDECSTNADNEEGNKLLGSSKGSNLNNLIVLDDFVRFDISRTGAFCCTGYKVSVQYEDDFLIGKHYKRSSCLSAMFRATNSVQFFSQNVITTNEESSIRETTCEIYEQTKDLKTNLKKKPRRSLIFSIEYPSLFACYRRRKKRKFSLKTSSSTEIGWVHTDADVCHPVEIYNKNNNLLFKCRKVRVNHFVIENGHEEKVGTIDVFHGVRGGISGYGVSTMDDNIVPETKALFVTAAVAMDIEEQESELKCTFMWTPLISTVIILLFSIIPWMYYNNKNSNADT